MKDQQPKRLYSAELQLRRRQGKDQEKPVPVLRASGGGDDPSDVSNADVLAAILALREEVAALAESPPPSSPVARELTDTAEAEALRIEIARMARSLGRAKIEIAAIRHPMSDDDRMLAAASELDAIVLATETATNDILAASEEINQICTGITALAADDETIRQAADNISMHVVTILEACNFQDITGQRISKVVRTLQFIEERVKAMIEIWGIESFIDLPMTENKTDTDEDLLSGPQLENAGVSQAEIDALFD